MAHGESSEDYSSGESGFEAPSDEVARLAAESFGDRFAGVSWKAGAPGFTLHLTEPLAMPDDSFDEQAELVQRFERRYPKLTINESASFNFDQLSNARDDLMNNVAGYEEEGGYLVAECGIRPELNAVVVFLEADESLDIDAVRKRFGPMFIVLRRSA